MKEGKIELPADFADIHNPGYGTHALLTGSGHEAKITHWVDPRVRLEWMFNTDETGIYRVMAKLKAEGSGKLVLQYGGQETEFGFSSTNGMFTDADLGTIEVTETGNQLLQLRPLSEGWSPVELGPVVLVKE